VNLQQIGTRGEGDDEYFGRDGLMINISSSAPAGSFSRYHVEMDYQHNGVDHAASWNWPREQTGLPYQDHAQIPYQRGTEPRGSMKVIRVVVTKGNG
jgi:hypothetical protein